MNKTIKTIDSLRSIHGNFSKKNVSEKNLKIILNSSVKAATASARQAYSIVVVQDKNVMKKLGYVGSKMLVFCVDFNRIIDLAHHMGYVYKDVHFIDFITGSTDTILAAQTAAISAKSLGIDSLFTNCMHRGDIERVYQLLNIPNKYCFPLIALVLGYPKKNKYLLKGRICGEGIIHFETYKRLNKNKLDKMVKEYDNPNVEFLSLINDWRNKGYKHYLDYFFEKWCKLPKKDTKKEVKVRSAYKINETFKKTSFSDDLLEK